MNNKELITKIKAEIEKRKCSIKMYCLKSGHDKRYDVVPEQFENILSFLSTLESEKPIVHTTVTALDKDLNPIEITADEKPMNQENSHEAEVNAALRKIDEEFLKQLSEKPINQDGLDEEIKRYIDEYYQADSIVLIAHVARYFAQWQKEQMLKEAVEGVFLNNPYPTICLDDCMDYDFKDNQEIRFIIVKED